MAEHSILGKPTKKNPVNPPALLLGALLTAALVAAACAPAAAPTPTPTKAAPAPTKAAEPTKPPAATPTTPPAPTATPRPATIKFGGVPSTAHAGVYIAIEKGYFKEQGITTETVDFRGTQELVPPLGTGQVELIGMPLSAALLAAADRGVELKVVAGGTLNVPNFNNSWVLLRKDLQDSGQVKSPADLRGMKLAAPSPGTLGEQTIEMLLQQGGLTTKDAEVIVLPFTDQPAAFANKAIAVASANEPNLTIAVQNGHAVKWFPYSSFFDGKAQGTIIVYGSAMLKDQDLGRRWMIAYLKGTRDYLKAFTAKEGRDTVISALIKYTPMKDPKLYDQVEMPYFDPNGVPDKKSIGMQYNWVVSKGLYTGKKTFDDITDLSFAEYASQRLGKQ